MADKKHIIINGAIYYPSHIIKVYRDSDRNDDIVINMTTGISTRLTFDKEIWEDHIIQQLVRDV